MKCQNCGRNEATYYYKSSINGRVTETHLCADCARKLGYVQRMQPDSFFGDDFFSHPFRLFEPLLGGFGNRLLTEFPEPVDVTRQAQQAVAEAPEDALVDKAEQERFSLQRQRNAPADAAASRRRGRGLRVRRQTAGSAEGTASAIMPGQ